MSIVFIPFDGWSPSSSHFGEGWATASDLAPIFETWRPWHRFVGIETASAAFGPCVGTHAHLWPSGLSTTTYAPDAATLFTGTPTRLFTVDPATGAFTDVSRAANYGAGVGATPAGWRFASVGNDIWACNWYDVPQRRTNNAGLFANGVTSAFVPVPRHMATIREHLVVANLNQVGRFVDELAWSDADNAVNFDPPTGTSTSIAGAKRLVSIPGQITALTGGQYGLAFKRRSIYYLEYTGTTQVFRPEILSAHVGTAYGSSIINTRYGRFFFGPDGFYRMVGLAEPEKISPPGVDSTILRSLFSTQGPLAAYLEDNQMVGFEIPGMPLVGWLFRVGWDFGGNDQVILHNPVSGAWTVGTGSAKVAAGDLFTTAIVVRPYASNIWETVCAFTWDGTVSRLAPLSSTVVARPQLSLRFRPAAFEEDEDKTSAEYRQSMVKGALPIFSRSAPLSQVTPSITVEALFDPFEYPPDPVPAPEVRLWSERNPAGYYPFQKPGRIFRLSINGSNDQDFENFEGVFIDQELLT